MKRVYIQKAIKHSLSVFWPEDFAEEQNLSRWDFGSSEDLPLRSHLDSLSWSKKVSHQ